MILKEGMNVKIVAFPKGDDPDSFSKKLSTDEFKKFLKTEARNFIDYKINISQLNDTNDPTKITTLVTWESDEIYDAWRASPERAAAMKGASELWSRPPESERFEVA